jgi:putative Ca2+/H+ antiporter (TMEM165/GDT1 family)
LELQQHVVAAQDTPSTHSINTSADKLITSNEDLAYISHKTSMNDVNDAAPISTDHSIEAQHTRHRHHLITDDDDEVKNSPMRDLVFSFLMILGSEIGDKTFLIVAVLAMRQPRLLIFTAAMTAMLVMSVLSAFLGHILPNLLPQRMVDLCTGALFLVFGIMMLREGWNMEANEQQNELDEVRAELEEKEWHNDDTKESIDMESGTTQANVRSATGKSSLHVVASRLLSPVFVQTFILVFLAEWGDRSQFATIAIAATQVDRYIDFISLLDCIFIITQLYWNRMLLLPLLVR